MTIAIIDGDVLAYNACESRWEKKVVKSSDGTAVNTVRLDTEGKRLPIEFTIEEDKEYLMQCWENFKRQHDHLLGTVFCNDYLMAVKGLGNFRKDLYPEYKMNRHHDPRNMNNFVPAIRELAILEEMAIPADGCEADDFIRIWAEEARAAGEDYIICSIDKDLLCIPGQHYIMQRGKERFLEVSEEEARRNFYEQLLKGDPTDNVPGIPRVGPVTAKELLVGCKTDEEFQEAVVAAYISKYGDEWKCYLLSNGKMIYLKRHCNDYFAISDWSIVKELE